MWSVKTERFKARQIQVAERLAKELGGKGHTGYTIVYEQQFKQCKEDKEQGIYDIDMGQVMFPEFLTPSRKSRIIVHITLDADYDHLVINRVMARCHKSTPNGNGGCTVSYSVNLTTIGSCWI